ncbi:MAG: nucleolar RNA-binding Nop10p family protein [Nanoarchaeota archaeon]
MSNQIMICDKCHAYTMKGACACGAATRSVVPPKFSPDDRHAHLTRQAKEEDRKARGLI